MSKLTPPLRQELETAGVEPQASDRLRLTDQSSRGSEDFSNPDRTGSVSRLHKEPINSEELVSGQIQRAAGAAKNTLVNQPLRSAGQVLGASVGAAKSAFDKLNDVNLEDQGLIKVKKVGLSVLSGGFILFALKSTYEFLTNFLSKDTSKPSSLFKFLDAGLKWVMGLGLWRSVTGKSNNLGNLKTVMTGGIASVLLSQLNGFFAGKSNPLASLAKVTRVDDTLKDLGKRIGGAPQYMDK
ncbi:MAG: hypothetical protein HOA17_01950 [Candidatus Melainabacteria bacterium]|nr:hypothetical protein [Candidatus Melainabacteria bacterium]